MPPRILPLVGWIALAATPLAQDLALESHASRWRLTAESFDVSADDDLGLVGVNFDLLDVAPDLLPGIYAGVGGYGAVSGSSGGLLMAGASTGWI